jgi:hypothetical protein
MVESNDPNGRRERIVTFRPALWIILAVALLSFFKGFEKEIQAYTTGYWVINSQDGLIRRGLLGQVFCLFFDRNDLDRIRNAALS